jgi:hypothetical protein
MKALLSILLLLFIGISLTLTAPSGRTTSPLYSIRQRVIYTVFTEPGVFNIEILWEPQTRSLTRGLYKNMDLTPGPGYTQVHIGQRKVDRWILDVNPIRAIGTTIEATILFTPPTTMGAPTEFHDSGVLPPGVSVMPLYSISLLIISRRQESQDAPTQSPRLDNSLVLMTVLAPGAFDLDPQTVPSIRAGRLRELIQLFFQQDPAGSSSSQSQLPPLPLRIDPEMWLHILTNTLGGYRGALASARPRYESLSQSCRGSNPRARQRRPDDQDDPEAKREGKRQCSDSNNYPPKDQGEAGGSNQGDRQADTERIRTSGLHIYFATLSLSDFANMGIFFRRALLLSLKEIFTRYKKPRQYYETISTLAMSRYIGNG